MKRQRIDIRANLRKTTGKKQKTLKDTVKEMVLFLEGFEYGENAIVLSRSDYLKHKQEFSMKGHQLYLGEFPAYQYGIYPTGHIILTTKENAEKMMYEPY